MTRCNDEDVRLNLKSSVYNQTGQNYFEQLSAYNCMNAHLRRILLAKSVVDTKNREYIRQKRKKCKTSCPSMELEKNISQDIINKLAYDTKHHPCDILRMSCSDLRKIHSARCHYQDICCSRDVCRPRENSYTRRTCQIESRNWNSPASSKKSSSPSPIRKFAYPSERHRKCFEDPSSYQEKQKHTGRICVAANKTCQNKAPRSRKCRYENRDVFYNYPSSFESSSNASYCGTPRAEQSNHSDVESIDKRRSKTDSGRQDEYGLSVHIKKKTTNCEEDAKYAQFAYDITKEIMQNGLYTDNELRKVFKEHLRRHAGLLNKTRMLQEIQRLKVSLNVVEDDYNKNDNEDEDEGDDECIVVKPPTPPKVLDENKVLSKLESYQKLEDYLRKSSHSHSGSSKNVILVDPNPDLLVTERDVLLILIEMNLSPKQAESIFKKLQYLSRDTSLVEMAQAQAESHSVKQLKTEEKGVSMVQDELNGFRSSEKSRYEYSSSEVTSSTTNLIDKKNEMVQTEAQLNFKYSSMLKKKNRCLCNDRSFMQCCQNHHQVQNSQENDANDEPIDTGNATRPDNIIYPSGNALLSANDINLNKNTKTTTSLEKFEAAKPIEIDNVESEENLKFRKSTISSPEKFDAAKPIEIDNVKSEENLKFRKSTISNPENLKFRKSTISSPEKFEAAKPIEIDNVKSEENLKFRKSTISNPENLKFRKSTISSPEKFEAAKPIETDNVESEENWNFRKSTISSPENLKFWKSTISSPEKFEAAKPIEIDNVESEENLKFRKSTISSPENLKFRKSTISSPENLKFRKSTISNPEKFEAAKPIEIDNVESEESWKFRKSTISSPENLKFRKSTISSPENLKFRKSTISSPEKFEAAKPIEIDNVESEENLIFRKSTISSPENLKFRKSTISSPEKFEASKPIEIDNVESEENLKFRKSTISSPEKFEAAKPIEIDNVESEENWKFRKSTISQEDKVNIAKSTSEVKKLVELTDQDKSESATQNVDQNELIEDNVEISGDIRGNLIILKTDTAESIQEDSAASDHTETLSNHQIVPEQIAANDAKIDNYIDEYFENDSNLSEKNSLEKETDSDSIISDSNKVSVSTNVTEDHLQGNNIPAQESTSSIEPLTRNMKEESPSSEDCSNCFKKIKKRWKRTKAVTMAPIIEYSPDSDAVTSPAKLPKKSNLKDPPKLKAAIKILSRSSKSSYSSSEQRKSSNMPKQSLESDTKSVVSDQRKLSQIKKSSTSTFESSEKSEFDKAHGKKSSTSTFESSEKSQSDKEVVSRDARRYSSSDVLWASRSAKKLYKKRYSRTNVQSDSSSQEDDPEDKDREQKEKR